MIEVFSHQAEWSLSCTQRLHGVGSGRSGPRDSEPTGSAWPGAWSLWIKLELETFEMTFRQSKHGWKLHHWNYIIWVWVDTYRYIFSGMNIHKSQLFWGSLGTRVLTHPHILNYVNRWFPGERSERLAWPRTSWSAFRSADYFSNHHCHQLESPPEENPSGFMSENKDLKGQTSRMAPMQCQCTMTTHTNLLLLFIIIILNNHYVVYLFIYIHTRIYTYPATCFKMF